MLGTLHNGAQTYVPRTSPTVVCVASAKAANIPEQYWKELCQALRCRTPLRTFCPRHTPQMKIILWTTPEAESTLRGPVGAFVRIGSGGVSISTGTRRGNFVSVGSTPGSNPFDYTYAASETQLHDDSNVALFFLDKDLEPGKTVTQHFTKSSNRAAFLSREVADTKPFSSKNLPEIYGMYSVRPNSAEAEMMKNTIKECEAPGIESEEKYCATSLESMIDFCRTKLGKDIQAVSTNVNRQTPKQNYTVVEGARRVADVRSVACHKENYPYAVFYCHKTQDTRFYMVLMKGFDKTTMEAVVACHTNTSKWNTKHLAFQVLKVEPGTVPICHFLPEDHVVWFSN